MSPRSAMRKTTAVRSTCTTTRESLPRNEDSAQPKINFLKKLAQCNFPSGPVVRTPLIQCSRCEFDPGSANEDSPLAGWHSRKRKKWLKKKKKLAGVVSVTAERTAWCGWEVTAAFASSPQLSQHYPPDPSSPRPPPIKLKYPGKPRGTAQVVLAVGTCVLT